MDGKPHTVTQKYLGSLEKIEKRMTAPVPQPYTPGISEYGASAALFCLARELDVIGTIDRHVPKRDQGLSVGQYLLLAALNRAICPASKRKLGEWFRNTALYHWIPVAKPSLLASQRFWDHMDRLDQDTVRSIEAEITQRMVNKFQLDLRCLIHPIKRRRPGGHYGLARSAGGVGRFKNGGGNIQRGLVSGPASGAFA